MNDNLEKLKKLLAAMDEDHLGKQDFLNAFQKVLEIVLQIKKETTRAIVELKTEIENLKRQKYE